MDNELLRTEFWIHFFGFFFERASFCPFYMIILMTLYSVRGPRFKIIFVVALSVV